MTPPSVFISYRHEDGYEAAGALEEMLKRAGLQTLRDTCFAQGGHLDDEVLRRLAYADLVVFIVTPKWGDGQWVNRELRYIRSVGKKALHVFLGDEGSPESVRASAAFRNFWAGADDDAHARHLRYFPWLHISISRASELDRVFVPILRALGRVPIVDWPRAEEFLPLRSDLPDKFLCLTERGLSAAVRDLMPANSAVVVPTSRGFGLDGEVSVGLCQNFGIDPNSLSKQKFKESGKQALGYGVVRQPVNIKGRDFALIAATALSESGSQRTSESLQRTAVRHALEVATTEYGCVGVVLPLFGTGPNVGLPVHQASRSILSEICCFMRTHSGPLAVAVSVPTSGVRERHIQHSLNYVRLLAAPDVPERLLTSVRFRLRTSPEREMWVSRESTVRQVASQLLQAPPGTLHARTRCYAWAGDKKVAPRGGQLEPYSYSLDTKVGDMVFCDGEIVSFDVELGGSAI